MDSRSVLKPGQVLPFPGMECEIDGVAGRGSNTIVYRGHYQDQQNRKLSHDVLIKELFPYEPKGLIYRDEQGNICAQAEGIEPMGLHRHSFLRGNEVHVRFLQQYPGEIDSNINTFGWNQTLYTILGFSGGRSLDKELQKGKTIALKEHVRRIRGALEVLGSFHAAGYLHLDISPDNILLHSEGKRERVTLIDYNSVHTLTEIREGSSVYYSAKEGYTAPEILIGRSREIGFSSDLYAMTAVFYTCLTGKRLSAMQTVRSSVPDISGAECLRGCPSTVTGMVRTILRKGLGAVPRRRYQSAAQMLTDLEELEDRISGKGITHWALWETGRGHVRKTIKENRAFGYIADTKKLYPLYAAEEGGKKVSLLDPEFIYGREAGRPILLLGSGGTGKTTSLLQMAYYQNKEYSPSAPAIVYISLYGWKNSETTFIRDRILENLRFKPHTDSMEHARHELLHLLSRPLHTKKGERPVLLLFLDGFNEAAGDTAPLLEEIYALSALPGVQIILTSRSEMEGEAFEKWMLCRLEQEDVRRILAEEGILPPENMELFELLYIPMMLSMYIRTALDGEKQLKLERKEQLIDAYFSALLKKEAGVLPEDTSAYMGTEAAVRYLLPEIAALIHAKQRSVTDEELLKLVEKCYKELSQKALISVFPQWIGHTSELRMNTKNADEWYGQIVLRLLWKHLGFLVRDEKGDFRILHQMIEEYMVERSRLFHMEFDRQKRRQRRWRGMIAAAVVMAGITAFGIYNGYMLNQLSHRQEEVLKNESLALAYTSEEKLSAGYRQEAIAAALSALPTENNECPYVGAAERALANALYVYQDSQYRPVHVLELSNEIRNSALSQDGAYFVAVDEYGQIRCYDYNREEVIWERTMAKIGDDEIPELKILESRNAVFCAGETGEAVLYALDTGKVLWRISYDEIALCTYRRIELADISDDEKTLVIGVYNKKENTGDAEYRYLLFYDLGTGKQKSRTDVIPVSLSMYCFCSGKGTFTEDGSTYIAVYNYENVYYLVYADVESGKILQTPWVKMKGGRDHRIENVTYLSETDTMPGGVLFYLCEYDWNISRGYTGSVRIGFLADGAEEWSFYKTYDLIGEGDQIPGVVNCEKGLFLISGQDIVKLSAEDGTERERVRLSKKAVYFSDEENLSVFLAFEDGSTGIFYLSSCELSDIESYTMTDFYLLAGMGSGIAKAPFCVSSASDENTVYLCEITGGGAGSSLSKPVIGGDEFLGGDIYALPGGDGFLYLDDEDLEEEEPSGADRCIYGTVYDNEGKIKDSFEFETDVSFVTDKLAVSGDGTWICSDRYLYNLKEHMLISMEELLPEKASRLNLRSAVTKDGILSACWDDGQIYLWLNGEEYGTDIAGEEKVRLASDNYNYYAAANFENMVLGENGLVIMKGSAGEKLGDGYPADYYLVYSAEEKNWKRIDEVSDVKGFPFVAAAGSKKWFASAGEDHMLRIYDFEQAKAIREWKMAADLRTIRDMQFILDDKYLVVMTYSGAVSYQIIRVDDGAVVYAYSPENGSEYSYINLLEEESGHRIYLTDAKHNMTGVCIDTESWESIFEVSSLRCVLDNHTCIMQNGYEELLQLPCYSLETLIEMGNAALKDENGSVMSEG